MNTEKTIPYTYLIKFIPENKFYYGVRYKKGCNPSDLFTTYFTSCKVIKKLVAEYGIDCFSWEIRKVFDGADDARRWETKVLQRIRAAQRSDFINQTNNISIPPPKFKSPETRKKISEANKGKILSDSTKQLLSMKAKQRYKDKVNHPMFGKTHSSTTKEKISRVHKNKIISDEQKLLLSEKSKNNETHKYLNKWRYRCVWKITHPTGEVEYVNNLTEFCKLHNLTKPLMISVSTGKQTHHKGFVCEKYQESSDFSNS